MRKKVTPEDRNIASVQTMVPVKVRAQLETLARQEQVPVSEIGRRAFQKFLEQKEEI